MPAEQRGSAFRTRKGWGVRWVEGERRPQRTGFGSKTEALNFFRDEIAPRLGSAPTLDPRRVTLAEHAERYLAAHAVGREPGTITTLRERLKRPLEAFGELTLAELEHRVVEIADWQRTLPEGSRYGIVQALRQTLEAAVRWRLMRANPAKLAGRNPPPKRSEIEPFTRDEIARLARELGAYGPLVVLAAETGLMPSEWIALERRDVDRAAAVLVVERSFTRGELKGYGKTSKRRRRVPLTAVALDALAQVPPRLDSPLVFAAPGGQHLDLHNWRAREWLPAVDAAGLGGGRRIYDLRHTYATEALAAGIPAYELARYMGTSVRMIDATYGHLASGSEAAAKAKLDARAAQSADVLASIWRSEES